MGVTGETRMTQEQDGRAGPRRARAGRAPRFDPEVLLGLGVDDPVLMEEVLITFMVASTDLLRDLFHQQRMGDEAGLTAGAARLREVAEAVGAWRLADTCGALAESDGPAAGTRREIEELFLIDRELDLAQAAVRTYLQGWLLS